MRRPNPYSGLVDGLSAGELELLHVFDSLEVAGLSVGKFRVGTADEKLDRMVRTGGPHVRPRGR